MAHDLWNDPMPWCERCQCYHHDEARCITRGKPVYQHYWRHVACGLAFWTLICVIGWSFWKVCGG